MGQDHWNALGLETGVAHYQIALVSMRDIVTNLVGME